jgi:hypothetical protein
MSVHLQELVPMALYLHSYASKWCNSEPKFNHLSLNCTLMLFDDRKRAQPQSIDENTH